MIGDCKGCIFSNTTIQITLNHMTLHIIGIITRQKDIPHFIKWRVPISAIGGGHISPASLKRSGRFFAKRAKNL
jgi:hypothetical protein